MMKTVPPLNDLFDMAGLNLPTYLKGEGTSEDQKKDLLKSSSDKDTTDQK